MNTNDRCGGSEIEAASLLLMLSPDEALPRRMSALSIRPEPMGSRRPVRAAC